MKAILFYVLIYFVSAGCAKKTAPTASVTSSKGTTSAAGAYSEEVVNREAVTMTADSKKVTGQNIYTTNCGKCHTLRSPGEFTRQQWKPIIERMAIKAKLTDAERAEVTFYINANARK